MALCDALDADPDLEVVRTKNRFSFPLFHGQRDVLVTVAVDLESATPEATGPTLRHLCELQVMLAPFVRCEEAAGARACYEFFRGYFSGETRPNRPTTERLDLLLALPNEAPSDGTGLDGVVDGVLAREATNFVALRHLDDLLASLGAPGKRVLATSANFEPLLSRSFSTRFG